VDGLALGQHRLSLGFQTVMALLGLDRLTVVRIPAQDMEPAGITLWFFTIILGGIAAFAGLVRAEHRRLQDRGS
jgi:hypothetical protein